jgi:nucleotide-binding universal stress UspA family protein
VFHPKRILHPTDFSDASRAALHIAADLARQYGASVLILHVAESLGPEHITFGEAGAQLQPEGYRHRLEAEFEKLVPAAGLDVPIEYLLTEGDSAAEIVRVAHERSCDLIVLGTHGRTGLRRLLGGSVAEHVVRVAPCPVLSIRHTS